MEAEYTDGTERIKGSFNMVIGAGYSIMTKGLDSIFNNA